MGAYNHKLADITGELGMETFPYHLKLYWRRNDDNYLLDYEIPSFYQNIHQTDIYGGEIQASAASGIGITTFGGEYNTNKIVSTNLGNHTRETGGFFAEQKIIPIDAFSITANAFLYKYPGMDWKIWPGFNMGYNISTDFKLFGSIGKAFRVSSYTELYYTSPVSIRDSNLQHEETLDYEIGVNTLH